MFLPKLSKVLSFCAASLLLQRLVSRFLGLCGAETKGRMEACDRRKFSIFICEVSSQFSQAISITFRVERGQRLIHFLSKGKKKPHSICDIHTEITASHKHSASLVSCVDHCDTLLGELCGVQKRQFKLSCWSSP